MPKVIKDLDKKIIEVATKQLFEKGYAKMTMRSISDECGIAVGTLYNYYKSKNIIVADVMLVDWSSMIKENELLFKEVVKLLEQKIEIVRKGYLDDYNEGVIDGLLIAIKTIEG